MEELNLETFRILQNNVDVKVEALGFVDWGGKLELWKEELKPYPWDVVNKPENGSDDDIFRLLMRSCRFNSSASERDARLCYEIIRSLGKRALYLQTCLFPSDYEANSLPDLDAQGTDDEEEMLRTTNNHHFWEIILRQFGAEKRQDTGLFEDIECNYLVKQIKNVLIQARGTHNELEHHLSSEANFGFSIQHMRERRYSSVEIGKIMENILNGVKDEIVANIQNFDENEKREFLIHLGEEQNRAKKSFDHLKQQEERNHIHLLSEETILNSARKNYRKLREAIAQEKESLLALGYDVPSSFENMSDKECDTYCAKKKQLIKLREAAQSTVCIEKIWKQHIEKHDHVTTNVLNEKKKILVLGYCLEYSHLSWPDEGFLNASFQTSTTSTGKNGFVAVKCSLTRHQIPVIVRELKISEKSHEDNLHHKIFEIGARNEGSYVEMVPENSTNLTDSLRNSVLQLNRKEDEFVFAQYIPPNKFEPGSKPLSKILETGSYTDVIFALPEGEGSKKYKPYVDVSEAGNLFLVSLKTNEAVGYGSGFTHIGVLPVPSVAPEFDSKGFERYIVISSVNNKLGTNKVLEGLKKPKFKESLEVIGQALSLMLALPEDPTEEAARVSEILERMPILLYFGSFTFFQAVSPQLVQGVTNFWRKVLLEKNHNMGPSAIKIINQLIVPSSSNKKANVAIVSSEDLKLLPKIISNVCRFRLWSLEVESSNVKSVLEDLREADKKYSFPNFYYVKIQGRIERTAIIEMITLANSSDSLKLIFEHSNELENFFRTLSTEKILGLEDEDSFYERQENQIEIFSQTTCLGEVFCKSQSYFSDPSKLQSFILEDLDADGTRTEIGKLLSARSSWESAIDDWMAGKAEVSVTDVVRIIISDDPKLSVEKLRRSGKYHIQNVDARSPKQVEQLRNLVISNPIESLSTSDKNGAGDGLNIPTIITLLEASLISSKILSLIVAQCAAKNEKILLILQQPTLNVVNLQLPNLNLRNVDNLRKNCEIPVIFQKFKLDEHIETDSNFTFNESFLLLLKVLRCLFGHGVLTSQEDFQALKAYIEKISNEKDAQNQGSVFSLPLGFEGAETDAITQSICSIVIKTSQLEPNDFLGKLLAMKILKAIQSNDVIPFPDFVNLPPCVALSQIHRIQGYICYLEKISKEKSPFIISQRFVHIENVLFPSPGPILKAKYVDTNPISERFDPKYPLPVPPSSINDENDIAQFCSLSGRSLHWNEIFLKWKNTPTIPSHVLNHLMKYGKFRLGFILAMDPKYVAGMKMNRQDESLIADYVSMMKVIENFEQTEMIKLAVRRLSALAWTIIQNGRLDVEPAKFKKVIEFLVSSEISFEISRSNSNDLIKSLISELIQLDSPIDLISGRQHAVREFMLSHENVLLMNTLAEEFKPPQSIGRTLIEAMFVYKESFLAVNSKFHQKAQWFIYFWKGLKSDVDMKGMIRSGKLFLSAPAIAAVLINDSQRSEIQRITEVIDSLLCPSFSLLSSTEKSLYLFSFLNEIIKANSGVAVKCLDCIVTSDAFTNGETMIALETMFECDWKAIFQALRTNSFQPIIAALANKSNFCFPLVDSQRILSIYLDFLVHVQEYLPSFETYLKLHKQLFPSKNFQEMVFKFISQRADLLGNIAVKHLLWYTWCSSPEHSLPVSPDSNTWGHFVRICELANLGENIGDAPSLLARFLCVPHTLSLSVYKTMQNEIFPGRLLQLNENKVHVAQKNHNFFPAYVFRVHERALPDHLRIQIVQRVRDSGVQFITEEVTSFSMSDLCPRLTEGVSSDILKHNLKILFHIQRAGGDHLSSITHLGGVILAWLRAFGFCSSDLTLMFDQKSQMDFGRSLNCFLSAARNTEDTEVVLTPLPVYLDVRYVDNSSSVRLFTKSPQSMSFTIQWIDMVGKCFDIDETSLARLTDRYSVDNPSLTWEPLLNAIMQKLAELIPNEVLLNFDTAKTIEKMLPLIDFLTQIDSQKLPEIFKYIAARIAASEKQQMFACIFSDTVFMLVGITPYNQGRIVRLLSDSFANENIPISAKVRNEGDWLLSKLYNGESWMQSLQESLSRPETSEFSRIIDSCPENLQNNVKAYAEALRDGKNYPRFYNHPKIATASSSPRTVVGFSNVVPLPRNNNLIGYDHVDVPSFPVHNSLRKPDLPDIFERREEDFKQEITISTSEQLRIPVPEIPMKISARNLIQIQQRVRHARLTVVPGQYSMLVRPNENRALPFARQQHMDRNQKSLTVEENDVSVDEIESLFHNHGQAWTHLSHLPPGSTITGKEFYLRKIEGGNFVMVVGGESDYEYFAWHFLDTFILAAYDLERDVLEIIHLIVWISWHESMETSHQIPFDDKKKLMDTIRSKYESSEYLAYVKMENNISKMILQLFTTEEQNIKSTIEKQIRELIRDSHKPEKTKAQNNLLSALIRIFRANDDKDRSSLKFLLEEFTENFTLWDSKVGDSRQRVDRSEKASANKLVAPSAGIGTKKFRDRFAKLKQKIDNTKYDFLGDSCNVTDFVDSDEEEEEDSEETDADTRFNSSEIYEAPTSVSHETKERVKHHTKYLLRSYEEEGFVDEKKVGFDEGFDRGPANDQISSLLPLEAGYGRPLLSKHAIMSILDHEEIPVYFYELPLNKLKMKFSHSDGLCFGFIFPKSLLRLAMEEFNQVQQELERNESSKRKNLLEFRQKMLEWLATLARAPLPDAVRNWFFSTLDSGPINTCAPKVLTNDEVLQACLRITDKTGYTESSSFNLMIVARSVANTFPAVGSLRECMVGAFRSPTPQLFEKFCERKNNMYGIHVVSSGTDAELDRVGIHHVLCDLTFESIVGANDDASLYLNIINQFTEQQFFVYVKGLPQISDRLLKWLAEFTVQYPWRFVYLENTDVSWNFAENRDRCVLTRAPPPVTRSVLRKSHLLMKSIYLHRPSHEVDYTANTDQIEILRNSNTWENVIPFTNQNCLRSDVDIPDESEDFREILEPVLTTGHGALVLLVGSPGSGKSHFSEQICEKNRLAGFIPIIFDGSNDELVSQPLKSILERCVPSTAGSRFLVVDEYHMLSPEHKRQLFLWLKSNAGRIRTLLIANRVEAMDYDLILELDKVFVDRTSLQNNATTRRIYTTRLHRSLIKEVMDVRNIHNKLQILRWFHCARSLFGGSAVSLRGMEPLDRLLCKRMFPSEDLESELLDKIPTISSRSAHEFVHCFWACRNSLSTQEALEAIRTNCSGTTSVLFQVALLTESLDDVRVMDFPDFVTFKLRDAYTLSPPVRFAAWISHILEQVHQPEGWKALLPPQNLLVNEFVDQIGFPFQLSDSGTSGGNFIRGTAFSWGGDAGCMEDLIDAVQHGRSVNWDQVHKTNWSVFEVDDIKSFCRLLSVSRSPAKVLKALPRSNLSRLLRRGNLKDRLDLALRVTAEGAYLEMPLDADDHFSPFPTAVWLVVLDKNEDLKNLNDLKRLLGADRFNDSEIAMLFVWASRNAMGLNNCSSDSKERSKVVHDILESITRSLIDSNTLARQHLFWSGMFTKLLNTSHTDKHVIRNVLALYSEELEWDPDCRAVWRILHSRATVNDVASINVELMMNETTNQIDPIFLPGLLTVNCLPMTLQKMILDAAENVPPLISCTEQLAVQNLTDAINQFVENEVFKVKTWRPFKNDRFKEELMKEIKMKTPESSEQNW